MGKIRDILDHVPIVNLIPIIDDLITGLPKAWEGLSDEKKSEISKNILMAGAKALSNYAKASD